MSDVDDARWNKIEVFDTLEHAREQSVHANRDGGFECGHSEFTLTEAQIAHLRAGKLLIVPVMDAEYVMIIRFTDEKS